MKSPAPGTFEVSPLQTIDFLAIAQVRFMAIQVSDALRWQHVIPANAMSSATVKTWRSWLIERNKRACSPSQQA